MDETTTNDQPAGGEAQDQPVAPEAQPQTEETPSAQGSAPPEYVPYKAFQSRINKKNATIEELQAEIEALKQQQSAGTQPPAAPTGQSQDPNYGGAQQVIQQAVQPLFQTIQQKLDELDQRTTQYQTQQQFEAHRQQWRDYVRQHYRNVPEAVIAEAERMVDQSLQAGTPIDPMLAMKERYADYMLRGGQVASQQAHQTVQEVSAQNQEGAGAGRSTVSSEQRQVSAVEEFKERDLRDLSQEEWARLEEELRDIPVSKFLR